MTEVEWVACTPHDINRMVYYLREKVSYRKLALFVCGCCRRLWPLLLDERFRDAIKNAEQNVDESQPQPIPYRVSDAVWDAYTAAYTGNGRTWDEFALMARSSAAAAVLCLGGTGQEAVALHAGVDAKYWARSKRLAGRPAAKRERVTCLGLLRCVAGNPFRPVAFDPEWRTSTAVLLAKQMYESRDFSTMPILADALQDAGCDNADILTHCRDESLTHVRGCWVVDLVLGKV